jgi:hypothetical protein
MMYLAFAGNWDATAVGTLALAVVTGVSLVIGWKSLRQGQGEVEEAHRPVLVPLADSRPINMVEAGLAEPPAARPLFLGEGQLAVPIENIGTGPALDVEVSVWMRNPDGDPTSVGTGGMTPANVAGIKTSDSVAPIVRINGLADVPGFQLMLTYEDVAGKGWVTRALYVATDRSYTDVTVNRNK